MRHFYCLLIVLVPFFAKSQTFIDANDPHEIKSLLGKGNDNRGFGGLDLKVSELKGTRGLIMGAYGGLVINRHYLFGVGGYGLVTPNEFKGVIPGDNQIRNLNLYGGYGGVIFGGTVFSKELIHLSFPVLFGAGSADVSDKDFFSSRYVDTEFTIENSVFFVVEPAAQLEINMTSFFRIAVGASYRYVTGSDLVNVSDQDLSGLTTTLSFRFGKF